MGERDESEKDESEKDARAAAGRCAGGGLGAAGAPRAFDAHCHLAWFDDPAAAARGLAAAGAGALAVTVTPGEFLRAEAALPREGAHGVLLAAGLHPWWVRDAADADALCELAGRVRWLGEVGLDASPRHAATLGAQAAAFERVCAAAAEASDAARPRALSVHAVRAATPVLDALERTGAAARCRCVLHWFSGTSEELWRAVRLGCLFSVGERMLATRRGREYARVLPEGRLLLETDLPAREGTGAGDVGEVAASLARAGEALAAARGVGAGELRVLLARNAEALLG